MSEAGAITDTADRYPAREQALREVLRIISTSRADERPVFDLILKNAAQLCGASMAGFNIITEDRNNLRLVAHWGEPLRHLVVGETLWALEGSLAFAQAMKVGRLLHIDDLADTDAYRQGDPVRVGAVDKEGVRTFLAVPLNLNGEMLGCIALYRRDVRPFTPADIELVETFAEQAVIAIENVRQFRELQTRLEREAATKEVLAVISQSQDDELPVFRAILERAERLCGADASGLQLVSDDRTLLRYIIGSGEDKGSFVPGVATWNLEDPYSMCLAVREARVVHVEDLKDSQLYRDGDPGRVKLVDIEGVRTHLHVPLLENGVAFGNMSLSRLEPRPFSADEIALVETFAAQAVIAINNVRQFRELQIRLEREAATREILGVISQSRDDEQPVFDVILRQAAQLCSAPQAGLIMPTEAGTHVRYVASWGPPSKYFEVGVSEWSIDDPIAITTAIRESRIVNIPDILEDYVTMEGHPSRLEIIEKEGIRSILAVPLIRNGEAIGCFDVYRSEVDPFSEDEVALIESFAAQAVIAIENVRQFREVQERLEREKASRDVLDVISTSRDDDIPVFKTILENASRICNAPIAFLSLANDERTEVRIPAHLGTRSAFGDILEDFREPITRTELVAVRPVANGKAVLEDDIKNDDAYRGGDPRRLQMVDVEGARSVLAVPLMRKEISIGAIVLYRREVSPFSQDDLTLVQNFAAQAVIAIENVRQFRALEALNAELSTRVEAQVGEIERMGRLKRFLPSAVADAVVSQGTEMLSSHRAHIATLFCDIRGFTAFCERAEPEETIEVLQTYHKAMGRLLDQFGAGVEHRIGDGIMAIFNDPLPCDDPAGDAVRLALAMRERMAELCKGWRRLGHRLGFGVGISLGYATVGMVGSEGRYEYTASGTSVNLASRLCDEADDGEIIISPRAVAAVEDDFELTPHGEVTLKGIRDPVLVQRVLGPKKTA